MADAAAKFDIEIETSSRGIDSTAAELNTLVDKIRMTDTVATKFDTVVAATSKRLEEASAAAKLASDTLGSAEKRYKELESAANNAAKQLERASAAGKDTKELAAAATAAKAKMAAQGKTVDDLREKSKTAAAAQGKLAESLKVLKGKQGEATAAMQKAAPATATATKGGSALAAGFGLAAAAAIAVALAVWGAVYALGAYAIAVNPAATMRLTRAQERMQLGMKKLFQGLKLDAFIGGLEQVMSLFDEGTSSANGMKKLIETIFQPIFDGAAKAAPYVKEFFKGMIYGALLVVIGVLSIRNAIFKAMSPETRAWIKQTADRIFTLENAFTAGKYAALAIAAVIGLAIAVLAIMWGWVIAIVAAIANWTEITRYLSATWDEVTAAISDAIDDLIDYVTGAWDDLVTGAQDAAANMITGIVDGIKAGAKWVYDAVKGLGSGAVSKFKSVLGIASPSKVFKAQSLFIAKGSAEGIEDGTPEVHSALEAMVSPADAPEGAPPAKGLSSSSSTSTSSSNSRTIHIASLVVGDSPTAKENLGAVKAMLLEVLEGASLTIGGGEAVPA